MGVEGAGVGPRTCYIRTPQPGTPPCTRPVHTPPLRAPNARGACGSWRGGWRRGGRAAARRRANPEADAPAAQPRRRLRRQPLGRAHARQPLLLARARARALARRAHARNRCSSRVCAGAMRPRSKRDATRAHATHVFWVCRGSCSEGRLLTEVRDGTWGVSSIGRPQDRRRAGRSESWRIPTTCKSRSALVLGVTCVWGCALYLGGRDLRRMCLLLLQAHFAFLVVSQPADVPAWCPGCGPAGGRCPGFLDSTASDKRHYGTTYRYRLRRLPLVVPGHSGRTWRPDNAPGPNLPVQHRSHSLARPPPHVEVQSGGRRPLQSRPAVSGRRVQLWDG